MTKVPQNDEELWRNILAGDSKAFTAFYDRYWLQMYKAALHYLKDAAAGEDVVQEIFITIWSKRQTLEIKNFAAYLNSATRYEVYRRLKVAKQSILEFHEEVITKSSVVYNEGYQKLNETDNSNIIDQCLKDLPKRSREIFYMSKVNQLTNTEIAEQLGITKHTVENQLARALKHFKLNLSRLTIIIYCLTSFFK
ncbi:MAG TPA: sigma-70 family RNA polymerase sigma factor [Hanamia sp.]|jgi:RNA polymerase sigma-70 factor (ECF subfamily)